MTSRDRDVQIEERANLILSDDRTVAAYARFVDAQLRFRWTRAMLARLCALARAMAAAAAFLSASDLSAVPGPAPGEGEGTPWGSPQ